LTRILLALLLAIPAGAAAQSRTVSLTFDDLPAPAGVGAAEAAAINRDLLATLARHQAHAIGFVIGERAEQIPNRAGRDILARWIDGGHDLGNHTYSHPDLNDLTVEQFGEQVDRVETSFRPLRPRSGGVFLRFPFNHAGDTAAKRDAVRGLLKARGYDVATCTIDPSDQIFAPAYAIALARHDTGGSRRIRQEYLSHTAAIIDYYIGLHRQLFGRETSHVMLLHANRLNADALDDVLRMFEERQFRFVSLPEAQSDPAYQTADAPTKFGPMWGYRWARSLGVTIDGRLEPEPAEWISKFADNPPAK
jgi:peptidoglycan/xylan/chitin deacetylase (PgdA/CDA1 family)